MDKYEVLELLEKDTFGKVYKIRRKSDNRILAWKVHNYSRMSEKEK